MRKRIALIILLALIMIFTLHSLVTNTNATNMERMIFETSVDLYIDKYMRSKFNIELPMQKLGINSILEISGELKGLPINQSFWNITLNINVCNRNGEKIVISYTNPLADIAFFSFEGKEIYRWSRNKFFTQVVNVMEVDSNKCISIHKLISDIIPHKYVGIISIARLYIEFNIGKYKILVLINMVRTPQVTIITRTLTLTTMPITTTTSATPQQFRFINIVLNKPNTSINISIETKIPKGALSYMYVSNGALVGLQIITNDFIEDLERFSISGLRIPGIELKKGKTYYIVSAFGAKDRKELVECLANELTKLVSLKIVLLEPSDLSNITKLLDLLKYREWTIATIHWDEKSNSWVISEYKGYYAHITITTTPSISPTYTEIQLSRTTYHNTNSKPIVITTPSTTTKQSISATTSPPSTTIEIETENKSNQNHISILTNYVLILIGVAVIIAITVVILLKKVFI